MIPELVLNELTIEVRPLDGFINATQICKAGGKRFNDWNCLNSVKDQMKILREILKNSFVVESKVGGNHSGTWIHPALATLLAQWISPRFAVKVALWLEEWKAADKENRDEYMEELASLEPSCSDQAERAVKLELHSRIGGRMEVGTPIGRIDLLTDEYLIEIKHISGWKSALGQVLAYSDFYPDHVKKVVLFGEPTVSMETIARICRKSEVEVEFV